MEVHLPLSFSFSRIKPLPSSHEPPLHRADLLLKEPCSGFLNRRRPSRSTLHPAPTLSHRESSFSSLLPTRFIYLTMLKLSLPKSASSARVQLQASVKPRRNDAALGLSLFRDYLLQRLKVGV